jgi:hypothetical protein
MRRSRDVVAPPGAGDNRRGAADPVGTASPMPAHACWAAVGVSGRRHGTLHSPLRDGPHVRASSGAHPRAQTTTRRRNDESGGRTSSFAGDRARAVAVARQAHRWHGPPASIAARAAQAAAAAAARVAAAWAVPRMSRLGRSPLGRRSCTSCATPSAPLPRARRRQVEAEARRCRLRRPHPMREAPTLSAIQSRSRSFATPRPNFNSADQRLPPFQPGHRRAGRGAGG